MKNIAIIIGAWFNENAAKSKVTFIFSAGNDLPTVVGELDGAAKMRIAAASGGAPKPLRSIYPTTEVVAAKAGIDVAALSRDGKNPTVFENPLNPSDLLGFSTSLLVEETVTQRANNNQEPKVNPTTGEVQTFNGQPIFRYVDVLPTEDVPTVAQGGEKRVAHTLLVSDQTKARLQAAQA